MPFKFQFSYLLAWLCSSFFFVKIEITREKTVPEDTRKRENKSNKSLTIETKHFNINGNALKQMTVNHEI